ncbi:MAG: Uma2 family endonuclease [Lachnospiraceae bacterium]|nr:Uma2 family endonuclease [Lachnospiraceae bacterium]
MTIAELKSKKQEYGLSNREISELSGVPLGTVDKIFSGQTAAPRYKTLQAISRALSLAGPSLDVTPQNVAARHTSAPEKFLYHTGTSSAPATALIKEPSASGSALVAEPSGSGSAFVKEPSAPYGSSAEKEKRYTIKDYLSFPEEKRCELIDGVIYDMGAPTTIHQYIARAVCRRLEDFILAGKGSCVTFISPIDVQPDPLDDTTIVQPDVIVVCDREKITRARIIGAPDLVVEVLSPSTRKKDIGVKSNVYERSGVREYWLVDPDRENVIVYRYGEDYVIQLYPFSAPVPVGIFGDECVIDFAPIKDAYAFILQ